MAGYILTGRFVAGNIGHDEVKAIHDKAQMYEACARIAKNHDAEMRAYEIRMRAARKAGELLKVMEKAKPGGDMGPDESRLGLSCFFDKDHQPRHLDDALEAADGALVEFRMAKADFYIEKAEVQRGQILAMKGKPKNRAAKK